jgi:hypothetical protein
MLQPRPYLPTNARLVRSVACSLSIGHRAQTGFDCWRAIRTFARSLPWLIPFESLSSCHICRYSPDKQPVDIFRVFACASRTPIQIKLVARHRDAAAVVFPPRGMPTNVRTASKVYVAIQRQRFRRLTFFHRAVLIFEALNVEHARAVFFGMGLQTHLRLRLAAVQLSNNQTKPSMPPVGYKREVLSHLTPNRGRAFDQVSTDAIFRFSQATRSRATNKVAAARETLLNRGTAS